SGHRSGGGPLSPTLHTISGQQAASRPARRLGRDSTITGSLGSVAPADGRRAGGVSPRRRQASGGFHPRLATEKPPGHSLISAYWASGSAGWALGRSRVGPSPGRGFPAG